MTLLIVGLVLFLGTHSVRIVADDWRRGRVAAMGLWPWKAIYSVVSIIGFVLIVWGYGEARGAPVVLYTPPVWTRHIAALLTIPAFILLVAAYVPGTRIKRAVGHPMVAGVKIWAFAHLIANGTLADVVLFGAFLAWAVVDYIAARRRDRAARCRLCRRAGDARHHRGHRRTRRLGGVRVLAARRMDRRATLRLASAAAAMLARSIEPSGFEMTILLLAHHPRTWLLALTALMLAACVAYVPPPQPSTYDRAYNAMLGAMSDQGVRISDAQPATGVITGVRGNITVTSHRGAATGRLGGRCVHAHGQHPGRPATDSTHRRVVQRAHGALSAGAVASSRARRRARRCARALRRQLRHDFERLHVLAICSTRVAPVITVLTRGLRTHHASASCASVQSSSLATVSSLPTIAFFAGSVSPSRRNA